MYQLDVYRWNCSDVCSNLRIIFDISSSVPAMKMNLNIHRSNALRVTVYRLDTEKSRASELNIENDGIIMYLKVRIIII